MRISKRDIGKFPERYQEQLRAALALHPPKPKPAVRCKQVEEKKDTRFTSPVDIVFHSKRKRLLDADNLVGKACLDSLVTGGVLAGDSSEYVRSVTHTQEKSDTEETIITITEI